MSAWQTNLEQRAAQHCTVPQPEAASRCNAEQLLLLLKRCWRTTWSLRLLGNTDPESQYANVVQLAQLGQKISKILVNRI